MAGDLSCPPPSADVYLMATVLHDWPGTDAARILGALRQAAPAHGRLYLLELVVPDGPGPFPAKASDVGMMTLFGGGRQRTEAEFRRLLADTGWTLMHVTPTSMTSVILATAS